MKRTEIINGQITCKKCGETRDKKFFNKTPNNESRRGICYRCIRDNTSSTRSLEWQECRSNLLLEGLRECTDCHVIQSINNYVVDKRLSGGYKYKCKSCEKNTKLILRYGLSLKDYGNMLEAQNNSCAICHVEFSDIDNTNVPHLDHCHTSGKARSILCNKCNFAIGLFNDSTHNLYSAINYLTYHHDSEIEYCI